MIKPSRADIRKFIVGHFNLIGFGTFCSDYYPSVRENFSGEMGISQKAIILIDYCINRGEYEPLLEKIKLERPEPYAEIFGGNFARIDRNSLAYKNERRRQPIFLNYASHDASFAGEISVRLQNDGWEVVKVGDCDSRGVTWGEAVNNGLESSSVFIQLISENAVNSREVRFVSDVAIRMQLMQKMNKFISLQISDADLPALWLGFPIIPIDALGHWWDKLSNVLKRED